MAATKTKDTDEVPEEIEESCVSCHHGVAGVERTLKPLLSAKATELEEKVKTRKIQVHV